jgi:hypothetical protein
VAARVTPPLVEPRDPATYEHPVRTIEESPWRQAGVRSPFARYISIIRLPLDPSLLAP